MVGSRRVHGARVRRSLKRELISRIYNRLVWLALHTRVRAACTSVTNASTNGALPATYDNQVYDCAGHADARRGAD